MALAWLPIWVGDGFAVASDSARTRGLGGPAGDRKRETGAGCIGVVGKQHCSSRGSEQGGIGGKRLGAALTGAVKGLKPKGKGPFGCTGQENYQED